jgi:hypothetical protein
LEQLRQEGERRVRGLQGRLLLLQLQLVVQVERVSQVQWQ